MNNVQTRIDRARWWALTEQPFYGSLAMALRDVLDPSVKTAATNGRVIRWSEKWVETLTDEEVRFILLHETLHCAHLHPWRLPCDRKGNDAGDHEINLTLQGVPGISMPEGMLADPQFKGMACEEILAELDKPEPKPEPQDSDGDNEQDEQGQDDQGDDQQSQQQGPQDAQGSGDGDQESDQPGTFTEPADKAPGSQEATDLRDAWHERVVQAQQANQALGRGETPADMARELERLRTVQVDWRQETAEFVRDASSARNDWSRPARRHAWQPVLYPRKRRDDLGLVIFARDTSGSVDDRIESAFSANITSCLGDTGCRGLVLDCDSEIEAEYWLEPGDECPLKARGGGGTDFRPVFARATELIEQGERVAGIVYLTDLDGAAPESSDIPTLWLATTDAEGPFGRTVRIRV